MVEQLVELSGNLLADTLDVPLAGLMGERLAAPLVVHLVLLMVD